LTLTLAVCNTRLANLRITADEQTSQEHSAGAAKAGRHVEDRPGEQTNQANAAAATTNRHDEDRQGKQTDRQMSRRKKHFLLSMLP